MLKHFYFDLVFSEWSEWNTECLCKVYEQNRSRACTSNPCYAGRDLHEAKNCTDVPLCIGKKMIFLITKLLVLLNWITWCLAERYYLIKFSFDNILLPGSKEILMTSIAFDISSPLFQEHGPNGEITQPAVQFVAVVRWSLEENVCLNRKIASEKMYAPEIAVLISVQVCSDWVQIVFQKVEIKNVIKL